MRRRLTAEEVAERKQAAGSGALNDERGASMFDAAVADARRVVAEDEPCPSVHVLLGLHAVFHEKVYGILPTEMRGRMWYAALAAAKGMLTREFAGDPDAGLAFVAWAWSREDAREQRRRAERAEDGGRRLGWALLFGRASAGMVGDWRAAVSRKRGSARTA